MKRFMQIKQIKDPPQRHIRFEVEDDDIEDWEESYLRHKEAEDSN